MNLRLSAALFTAIDHARAGRPGRISRTAWIAEAVQEKRAREVQNTKRRGGASA